MLPCSTIGAAGLSSVRSQLELYGQAGDAFLSSASARRCAWNARMIGEQSPKKLVGYYRSPRDAERDHPNLDRSAPMRKAEFADITAQCDFPEADYVQCQLEAEENPGELCQQAHGRGWIMLNSAGVEGYIGGVCATHHFKAHAAFSGATARARREVSLQKTVSRLQALLDRREPLQEQVAGAFERARLLRDEVKRLREKLPYRVKERLLNATKTGNRSVSLEFETIERVEDANGKVREVPRWRPEIVGFITAPNALDMARLHDVTERIRAAGIALGEAQASLVRKESQMGAWAEALEGIDRFDADLVAIETDLETFLRTPNVSLLCWLSPKDEDQLACARLALQCTSGAPTSNAAVRKARKSWYDDIVSAHEGRRFRVSW